MTENKENTKCPVIKIYEDLKKQQEEQEEKEEHEAFNDMHTADGLNKSGTRRRRL
jgi:hypothetical protein